MPKRQIGLDTALQRTTDDTSATLQARFDAIRAEQGVAVDFPPDVLQEARRAVVTVDLPARDETALPFVTIDPAGSMDLDQAMFLERDGVGYRVRYAIADVPAFVAAGGAVDLEARRRGQTIYAPDRRSPLHPPELSEGAASLLPDQVRPAFVWDLRLAEDGEGTEVEVYRAQVRSVARLNYAAVQATIDDGSVDEHLLLLKEIGEKRIERERSRGGSSLPMPDQQVVDLGDGRYGLEFRPLAPAEDWNAQISLLTGMGAAELMLRGRVGILRTMPAPEHRTLARFRRQAQALGVPWADDLPYGEFLRSLDRTDPHHLALIYEATSLFRGAGYTPFSGTLPAEREHAAVAAAYAHVTAPLRRLVDRFGLVVCAAISAGTPAPEWALDALDALPDIMRDSDRRAGAVERACQDAVEAAVLSTRLGETFDAVAVDRTDKGTVIIQILDPAVVAHADGEVAIGTEVKARLVSADIATGKVGFELVF